MSLGNDAIQEMYCNDAAQYSFASQQKGNKMEISIKWFDGSYPSFNVGVASKAGNEPFVEIKGCRIVQGKDCEFVATPSTKNEKTGKYWNHAYFSKDFAAVVLEKAKESQPQKQAPAKQQASDPFDDDNLPF